MKKLIFLLFGCGLLNFYGCKDSENSRTGNPESPATIPASSFKVIIMTHPVKDFNAWKTAYDLNDSLRQVYGVIHYMYGRDVEDSSKVLVINKIVEGDKPKDFADLPQLKADIKKAGVIGDPQFTFADIIRNDDAPIEQKERIMLAQRVKDFGAWLKAYDEEGMHGRQRFGLNDRALGRDLHDSNMVYLFFAVTDTGRARQRIISDEWRARMAETGAEGTPQLTFFRLEDR